MSRSTAVVGIDRLLTMDPEAGGGCLGERSSVDVVVEDGVVAWIGKAGTAPPADESVLAGGCVALPPLVDCHTHTVWAGSRADEFRRRLAGVPYSQILEEGGGILSTVDATRAASAEVLTQLATERLRRMAARGVRTVEIKGGYGLNAPTEVRMLRAARAAGEKAGVRVFTSFLGAHAIPREFRHDRAAYVQDIVERQLPAVVGLADFIDIYVDRGAFTVEEARVILAAGAAAGLGIRVHAEQVTHTGSAALAAELGALSADHLERIDAAGIAAMARAGTVGVLLPGAQLYLRDTPPPVAELRAAGVPMAVATDFNPGSSPVDDLWSVATLATVLMGLTVEEALLGITRNAARALGREQLGRVRVGSASGLLLVRPQPGQPPEAASLVQFLGGPSVVWCSEVAATR